MKKMACKICGSTDITVDGDMIECNSCGNRYTLPQKKSKNSKVDVSGSTVRIDYSKKVENLLKLAHRDIEDGYYQKASDLYSRVLEEEPDSFEAVFYERICMLLSSLSREYDLNECIDFPEEALHIFKRTLDIASEYKMEDTQDRILAVCSDLVSFTRKFMDKAFSLAENKKSDVNFKEFGTTGNVLNTLFKNALDERCKDAAGKEVASYVRGLLLEAGTALYDYAKGNKELLKQVVGFWDAGIGMCIELKDFDMAKQYIAKIKEINPKYIAPKFEDKKEENKTPKEDESLKEEKNIEKQKKVDKPLNKWQKIGGCLLVIAVISWIFEGFGAAEIFLIVLGMIIGCIGSVIEGEF